MKGRDFKEDHFASLHYYFQHDEGRVVTYLPSRVDGIHATDVQIFSYERYGIQPEEVAEWKRDIATQPVSQTTKKLTPLATFSIE